MTLINDKNRYTQNTIHSTQTNTCDGRRAVSGFRGDRFHVKKCPGLLCRIHYVTLHTRAPIKGYVSHGSFECIASSVVRRAEKSLRNSS
jgi:hypothetical protein